MRASDTASAERPFISTLPAGPGVRRLALAAVAVSAVVFVAALPFAKQPLPPVPAFIPVYQSALIVADLMTAVLLFGQFSILRLRGMLLLAAAYLFCALMAAIHMLTFPGLFAPGGLLGAGPQTTAWLYMFWHAGFPLLVIAYALDKHATIGAARPRPAIAATALVVALAAAGLALVATAGQALLPPIMQGNRYTPAMIMVVSTVWTLSGAALYFLWRRPPHSVLDAWLMVVACAWMFDIALAAVFNAGRFDLGFYAGRIYGLLAATFVLVVLLLENTALYARFAAGERRLAERLRMLHEIDRAIIAEQPAEAIAAAVIQPLRGLLGVPRAIVNRFDLEAGEVEWVAAAGRRRTRLGGVRYSARLMGDLDALRRGEPQRIDVAALPDGEEKQALLAGGVSVYMAVPMIAGGELIGALSFGDETGQFHPEQIGIAQEVAAQLAIALTQAQLLERVRRQAEQLETRVAERTAELDDLYNRAPCGYHSVDADGTIVRVNDTWLDWLGYPREEVVNRMKHPDLMTPASAQRFWAQAFPTFQAEGRLDGVEFEYRRKNGATFIGSLNATSIYDAAGRYVMSRSTVFDVTELKRVQAELEAANKELEAFTYSVSHDLRAPLRAVDGYARMLEEDYAARLDDEGRRLLAVVRSSSRQMGQLIDDLLEFSQLSRQGLVKRSIDMTDLVWDVARELTRTRGGQEVDISPLPPALGDRALFRQVWLNLIGNALKYSAKRDSPCVEIGGREENGETLYWVRDNGVGFDMRYAQKLFGVFQRLHRAEEFEGTGVGLAIVQRVVARHGGRVWAEGELGKGACFSFALPK